MSQLQPSKYAERIAHAKFKRYIKRDDGSGFWLISSRPFAEAATEIIASAVKANKPSPTVLSSRTTPQ